MRRLDAVIQAAIERPFSWGTHDCITFAADCVDAVTGSDPLNGLRGAWCGQFSALRRVARMGGMRAVVASALGPEIAPAMATVGDIGMLQNGAAVVCNGAQWLGLGELGLMRMGRECVAHAWRCEGVACLK